MSSLIISALRSARHELALAWRRPAVAALALMAALACLATTGAARADFAARTRALHSMIGAVPPSATMITVDADWGQLTQSLGRDQASIAYATRRVQEQLAAASLPLADPATASWTSLETPERSIIAPPAAAQPGNISARIRLVYRDAYRAQGRLVSGTWPTDAEQTADQPLEADLTPATAKRLGVGVGSVLTVQAPSGVGTARLLVVGLVAPRDPGALFWAADQVLAAPEMESSSADNLYWAADALIGRSQAFALADPRSAPSRVPGLDSGAAAPFIDFRLWWGFPLDLAPLDADGAAPLADRLDTLSGIEDALAYDPSGAIPVYLSTALTPILRTFVAEQRTTLLETAMPLCGLALIAAIAGALLAYAAVDRRRAEAAVLRARGAGIRYLAGEALVESLMTALPASIAGVVLGLAIPGLTPPWLYPVVIAAAVFATLAPALVTVLIHRPRRAARVSSPARKPGRIARQRRLIAQGALAAACIAGIDLIHSQGLTPGGSINPFAAAAPVLAASLAALVTVNALPIALRALRRRALLRRGVVALLGVARAAYEPGTGQAATFVLTTAACTADLCVALADQAHRATPGPLAHAAIVSLDALAAVAVVAASAVAALAVRLGAASRRAADDRLTTMGLTVNQARAITIAENAPPALAGALTGALVTVPLLRIVGPALGVAAIPASARSLVLPALAVAIPAAAAGVVVGWWRGAS